MRAKHAWDEVDQSGSDPDSSFADLNDEFALVGGLEGNDAVAAATASPASFRDLKSGDGRAAGGDRRRASRA
ncbi:MAG: hypothetical protein WKF84_00020 [Pyrinomonadaceae bacterium]